VSQETRQDFSHIEPDASWSFSHCTARHTGYITHCYHRYPAKFIPQLAARLIRAHSEPGDFVLDPFMGSGTTLVEALVNARRARGIDINPAAVIAARAKTTPISPIRLRAALGAFEDKVSWLRDDHLGRTLFPLPEPLLPTDEALSRPSPSGRGEGEGPGNSDDAPVREPSPQPSPEGRGSKGRIQERLDWWFPRSQQRRLGTILAIIQAFEDPAVRRFLQCAFSHTLKAASYWLMKSSKPTRDKNKLARGVPNPVPSLLRHIKKMERANDALWRLLPDRFKQKPATVADVRCGDARKLPWKAKSVALVVTSPPYVTSYEYADLHELTTLWLGGVAGLPSAKERFIGSAAARARGDAEANSALGRQIVAALRERSPATAQEVRQYFVDMEDAFREMHRVLELGGRLCNIIGNTTLEGVAILNAEVHAEILESLGFEMMDVIRRIIPLKTLPQVRDPETGRFTSARANVVEAYPEELIVIARKR
jgi:DNA modification methylase